MAKASPILSMVVDGHRKTFLSTSKTTTSACFIRRMFVVLVYQKLKYVTVDYVPLVKMSNSKRSSSSQRCSKFKEDGIEGINSILNCLTERRVVKRRRPHSRDDDHAGCVDTAKDFEGNTVPSNVDADTASRLWLQLQQNTLYCDSQSAIAQYHATPCSTPVPSTSHNGKMPTKIELTLEQSQQGVSNDICSQAVNKSPTHYPCDSARTFRVILFSIHNDEWKSFQCHHQTALRRPYALSWKPCQGDSLNLPDHRIHKDGDGDASFQLKSDSLPHAHAQTTKTFYKHQDSRIMKAQELKTKTSAQTLIYKIFLQRYQVYQGRLLASFQDDAKYEHVGQDTRSQGGKDDQDGRIKI
ncbi:hypothetical protein Tco_0608557 [Tanacetum coccineum]